MRLATKLLLGFSLVALLLLVTGSLSYYFSNEIKSELINESERTTVELQNLTEMTVLLQNSLLYTRNYIVENRKMREGDTSLQTVSQVRQSEEVVIESLNRFSEVMDSVHQQASENLYKEGTLKEYADRNKRLVDSLQNGYRPYRSLVLEIIEIDREGGPGDEAYNVTIEPYFRNTLFPILNSLRENSNDFVDLQLENIQESAESTLAKIVSITLFGFILSLLLAFIVYRSIAHPLNILTSAARELGDGKLDQRINLQSKDELGKLARSFNKMAENLSKSMVSRTYVNSIIQSMGDLLLVTSNKGAVIMSNRAVYEKLGYSKSDLEGVDIWDLFRKKDRENIRTYLQETGKEITLKETFIKTKNGETIPVIYSHSTVNDELTETHNHVFVISDITNQKENERKISDSLQEKNVLLSEVHHRVKNNLAVICGLLNMQMYNLENEGAKKALQQSQLRIQSIALVHEKLYQNEIFTEIQISEFIRELAVSISEAFDMDDKEILINYEMEDVTLNINQAIPFSLLVNECITNTFKHAFEGKTSGEILVNLSKKDSDINVEILDNGIGLPDGFDMQKENSLGVTLVRTLVTQLNGKSEYHSQSNNKGTRFLLSFPQNME
ncbi:MAG: histidine kinase dimerization/phosphoacceptor domain -containing protein [Balneolaceae bacterium]